MSYKVVSFADIRQSPGNAAHQLTSKAVLHQVADAETSLFRVKPGGRIKAHLHQKVWDLFYGVAGDGVIAYAEINPDYTRRPDPADLVPVLDAFRAKRVA